MGSRVAVVGTGYVGLTTGVCFSHLGHDVTCADIDPEKIDRLNRGEVPILEAGLEELIAEGLEAGRLRFVLGAEHAVADAEFVYLCVPTPQGADGSADLSYLDAAAAEISPHLQPGTVVINKSTVPVGSTRRVERALGRSDIPVVSNPEFLREGSAVADFLKPDRVVIGADDQSAAIRVASLYLGVPAPFMVTDPASAETIKYASNAFLATKLSFVNAVSAVCEAVGADVNDVVLGMGYDKRIGHEFLRPGPGWGGSCFAPEETVLARRGWRVRLLTFERLAAEVAVTGVAGWEVLAWAPDEPRPEFHAISALTERPFTSDLREIRTKMGRRLQVTPDHPFVVGDGTDGGGLRVALAVDLDESSWLPLALDGPLTEDGTRVFDLLDAAAARGIGRDQVIARFGTESARQVAARRQDIHWTRRRDILRCGAARAAELDALDVDLDDCSVSTVTNGTYVPTCIVADEPFWRMIGLFLAEGHIGADGARKRIAWSFHPDHESHLVEAVVGYWEDLGVKCSDRQMGTARQVSISSRILAAFFEHDLGVGSNCYSKRIPDAAWTAPLGHKRALLRGLWEGDGSWSYVSGGPRVVLEYGTVSRELADGMVRLLAELDVVARLRVGRTTKSTVDTYWLTISGADQVELAAAFLLGERERELVIGSVAGQAKRIAPTGYRRIGKSTAWVRVTSNEPVPSSGRVYSVEVPGPHTVVTSFGLVAHNCFPKDVQALIRIAEDAGYDFELLRGVVEVNLEQFDRTAAKIEAAAGGSLAGTTIGVWGLTFKANTDDLRDSPSLSVISRLVAKGATVRAFDPAWSGKGAELPAVLDVEGLEVVDDAYAACEGASVLAVLTEWDELKWLDLDKVKELLAEPAVVDARNLLDRSALLRRGFSYRAVGRP
jgi:UDPglucose 6-dehydrogenase